MKATRREIEDAFFDWAVAATGLDESAVLWAEQPVALGDSAPQPATPYLTLKIIAGPQRVGLDDVVATPPVGSLREKTSVIGERSLTLSVNAYGVGASDLVQALIDSLQAPSRVGAISVPQVVTIKVATVTPSVDYIVTIEDATIGVTSGLAPTATEIRDAQVAAINLAEANASAEAGVAADEFVLTSRESGSAFALEIDDKLVVVSVKNAVDLALLSDTGETDVSELLDGAAWERRSNVDFFFVLKSRFEDSLDVIESMTGSGEVMEDAPFSFTIKQ